MIGNVRESIGWVVEEAGPTLYRPQTTGPINASTENHRTRTLTGTTAISRGFKGLASFLNSPFIPYHFLYSKIIFISVNQST